MSERTGDMPKKHGNPKAVPRNQRAAGSRLSSEWVYFVLLFLALWLPLAKGVYSQYLNFAIEVDGEKVWVKQGSMVSETTDKAGVPVWPGKLIDIEGQLLTWDGGGPPRFHLDGRPVSAETVLYGGDVLETRIGTNRQEPAATERQAVAPSLELVGRGPLIVVAGQGEPGERELVLGSHSRKVVADTLIRPPTPRVFTRASQSPKPVVALTFDDGPHPRYTRQVLAVLREHHVPAAFFVIGTEAKKHPDILREIASDGHIVGNHSYTHSSLVSLPFGGVQEEIEKTEGVVKEAIGEKPRFFRPPYGDFNLEILDLAFTGGYLPVLWNVDPADWSRRGANLIADRVVSQAGAGSVILLHDGGGNQEATVEALPTIIRALKATGYSFVSIEEMLTGHGKVTVSTQSSDPKDMNSN